MNDRDPNRSARERRDERSEYAEQVLDAAERDVDSYPTSRRPRRAVS